MAAPHVDASESTLNSSSHEQKLTESFMKCQGWRMAVSVSSSCKTFARGDHDALQTFTDY